MDKELKVSQEQIEQLYVFTRKHFVDYYDLQTELVDHLANAIEQKWQEQPKLSFDDALKAEFKKFGIFGFTTLVERRQLALTKKYNRLLWAYFKEFFKLPKILLTLALVIGLVMCHRAIHPVMFEVVIVGSVIFALIKILWMGVHYKKKVKRTGQRWMFEEIITRCGGAGFFAYLPYNITRFFPEGNYPVAVQWIAAALIVAFILYEYVILFVIPSKIEEHLKETYPEYGLEISN